MTTSLPGQRPNSSPPHGAILLVSVNCLLLLILQFTSLTKLWVIVTGYRGSLEEYVGLVLNIEWTLYDLTLFGLFGLSVVVLVAFEILRGSWTTFLAWVIESERRTKTVVLAFSLIAVRYYFTPGALSWVGDAALHTLYAWIAGEGFAVASFRSGHRLSPQALRSFSFTASSTSTAQGRFKPWWVK